MNLSPIERAFLDVIAYSELGADLLVHSDNGYNVIVGSTANNPDLFTDYSDHPNKLVHLGGHLESTAAGRYQILARNFYAYRLQLKLPDFSPDSQDQIAMQMIRECRAIPDLLDGNIPRVLQLCASRWASFPGAGYGQTEHSLIYLMATFRWRLQVWKWTS